MIISEEYKYIFVGLPFSASSTISQELIELYGGKPLLKKHSNITSLNLAGIDIKNYFVFAVIRDPVEIVYSVFTKLKTNAKEVFTNPNYFIENGGHVTAKERSRFKFIADNSLDFNEFLRAYYKFPYNNVFSLNYPYLDYAIDFSNLSTSFQECLQEINIPLKRTLPIRNKTKNKVHMPGFDQELITKVFGPYYHKFRTYFSDYQPVPISSRLLFLAMEPIYKRNWQMKEKKYSDEKDRYFSKFCR